MHINDLPQALLEEIFYLHVCVHLRARSPLLLTCRHWHNITTTYHALWNSISWGSGCSGPPSTVHCSTLAGLALISTRTGSATFRLYLGAQTSQLGEGEESLRSFLTSAGRSWLSRCQSLKIHPYSRTDSSTQVYETLFNDCCLDKLETLTIVHSIHRQSWGVMLQSILVGIERSAFNIRKLQIRLDSFRSSWVDHMICDSQALKGITSLRLRWMHNSIPWTKLSNLTELELWSTSSEPPWGEFDSPMVKSLILGGQYSRNKIPWKLLAHLTYLSLKDFTMDEPTTLHLPSVTHFSMVVCYFDLHLVNAPKVEEFTVRTHPGVGPGFAYPAFQNCLFTPRVVNMDIKESLLEPETRRGSVDAVGPEAPLPIWRQVEELNLRLHGEIPELSSELLDALSGASIEQCYPNLHSLTVLYPAKYEDGIRIPGAERKLHWWVPMDDTIKDLEIQQIKNVMTTRMMRQGRECWNDVALGWYVVYDATYWNPQWWVLRWKDLLLESRATPTTSLLSIT